MRQSEAVQYLETMLYASQKTRSNMVDKIEEW